jgi:hypothetical protein
MIGIAQPSFARTSTAPVVSFNAPAPGGFQTSHEIMEQARGIVNIEAWRSSTRELRPYGSTSSIDPNQDQAPNQGLGEGSGSNRRFSAGAGEGAMAGEIFGGRERGMKRAQEVEEEDEEGTEVDEDEFQPHAQDQHQEREQGTNDFPPVFASPNLSQPELFHQNAHAHGQMKQTRFAVPALPRDDRMKRALPARRVLGKSVSAPVGRLGGGMDVDMNMEDGVEDGFDISEWAGKEDF